MTRRDVMVVVQKGDHSLGYYDLESGEELHRVPLDPYPHEFVLNAERTHAYLCHFGVALAEDEGPGGNTVSIVEIAARKRVGTVDCGEWRRPHGIDLDAGGTLYVLSEGTSNLLVIPDPLSGQVARVQPTGGKGSHILSVTPDGMRGFSSNMFSGTVTGLFLDDPERPPLEFPVGDRPEGSVLAADSGRLYVTVRESHRIAVIDTASLEMLEPIPTPPGPVRICQGPGGLLLAPLYHDKSLALVDPAAGVMATVTLPDRPISIGFHPGSGLALVSTFGDRVCLVDVENRKLARTIRTRKDPDPAAVVSL